MTDSGQLLSPAVVSVSRVLIVLRESCDQLTMLHHLITSHTHLRSSDQSCSTITIIIKFPSQDKIFDKAIWNLFGSTRWRYLMNQQFLNPCSHGHWVWDLLIKYFTHLLQSALMISGQVLHCNIWWVRCECNWCWPGLVLWPRSSLHDWLSVTNRFYTRHWPPALQDRPVSSSSHRVLHCYTPAQLSLQMKFCFLHTSPPAPSPASQTH